jgi:hypothetical protein
LGHSILTAAIGSFSATFASADAFVEACAESISCKSDQSTLGLPYTECVQVPSPPPSPPPTSPSKRQLRTSPVFARALLLHVVKLSVQSQAPSPHLSPPSTSPSKRQLHTSPVSLTDTHWDCSMLSTYSLLLHHRHLRQHPHPSICFRGLP